MDKNKIYIGVYKSNNQESLFYPKTSDTYYDLKQKKVVHIKEISEDSLILYNDIIECKSSFKRNNIKLYDLDRMKKISLNRVFIGNSYQITRIISKEYFGTTFWNSGSTTHFERKLLEKDLLLIFNGNYYDRFKSLETGNSYGYLFNPSIGDIYVDDDNLKPAATELDINNQSIQKGKLLEKYREYKRR